MAYTARSFTFTASSAGTSRQVIDNNNMWIYKAHSVSKQAESERRYLVTYFGKAPGLTSGMSIFLDGVTLKTDTQQTSSSSSSSLSAETSKQKNGYRQRNVRQSCNQPKAHFGVPGVRPWDNRGKCYMDEKRIQCLSNASQHVPIYLKPFPTNSTRKFKSSPFSTILHILASLGTPMGQWW